MRGRFLAKGPSIQQTRAGGRAAFGLPQPCPSPQVSQTQLEESMAEQEPTAEQLAQIAAENEEDEHSVNYKPPAQKSIQEIQELDKDDESLRKYKEALLGRVTVSAGKWAEAAPRGTPVTCGFLLPAPPTHQRQVRPGVEL